MIIAPAILAGLLPAAGATPVVEPMPGFLDVEMQVIARQDHEGRWPFAADAGTLACVRALGDEVVIFLSDPKLAGDPDAVLDDFVDDKSMLVTTNPITLYAIVNKSGLLKPDLSIEDKIMQLGPFVTMGKTLCKQIKRAEPGPSKL